MLRGEHCIQHSLFCLSPLSIPSMEHKGRKRKKKKKEKSSGLELTAISLGLIGKKWSSSYKETKT